MKFEQVLIYLFPIHFIFNWTRLYVYLCFCWLSVGSGIDLFPASFSVIFIAHCSSLLMCMRHIHIIMNHVTRDENCSRSARFRNYRYCRQPNRIQNTKDIHDTRYTIQQLYNPIQIDHRIYNNNMKLDITEAIQSVNVFLVIFLHVNEYYLYLELCVYSILRGKQSLFKSIFQPKTTATTMMVTTTSKMRNCER